jgi:hypothetical protein
LALLDEYVLGEDMKLVRCPDELTWEIARDMHAIFLAGGITDCPDWQQYVISNLERETDLALINPRRENFDVTDPECEKFQIAWEHRHIMAAHIMIFWFPEETLCPITLFELGKCVALQKEMVVGCHPGYKRRTDVIEQLRLMDKTIKVVSSLDDIIEDFKTVY